jgi:CheY-like chemotaxis protein
MTNVLVVENNSMIRSMYIAGLGGNNYDVVATESIEQAKDALAKGFDPDVVLLDLHLGDEHGRELIRHIRKDLGRTDIKIIVATGLDLPEREIEALGADLFLMKPVELVHLLNTIQAFHASSEKR